MTPFGFLPYWPPHDRHLSVHRRNPPDVVFKRESVAKRAHVPHCDPFPPFHWHEDPNQEINALLQNLLLSALSAVCFLFYLVIAFSHFDTCPNAEFFVFEKSRPVTQFSSCTCLPHQGAIESQVPDFSQELERFLLLRLSGSQD